MLDLIIACNSNFGLDVKLIVEKINEARLNSNNEPAYHLKGFICPEGTVLRQYSDRLPILGTIESYSPQKNDRFALGIIDPYEKAKSVKVLLSKSAIFVSLFAPWVLAPKGLRYGAGCIIAAQSIVRNAVICNYVTLIDSMIAAATIGDYSTVMQYSNITSAQIGERVLVEENAVILHGIQIGDGAHIMPGSIVVKSIKPGATVGGNPARRINKSQA